MRAKPANTLTESPNIRGESQNNFAPDVALMYVTKRIKSVKNADKKNLQKSPADISNMDYAGHAANTKLDPQIKHSVKTA
jgi:hypothetical protein